MLYSYSFPVFHLKHKVGVNDNVSTSIISVGLIGLRLSVYDGEANIIAVLLIYMHQLPSVG